MSSVLDLSHLIGVPFLDRGRSRSGMDCWGLAMAAFKAHGLALPDYGVPCDATGEVHSTMWAHAHLWERTTSPTAPALVVMRFHPRFPKMCTHVGTLVETLGGPRILHIMRTTMSTMQRPDHLFFKGRIEGYFQWRG